MAEIKEFNKKATCDFPKENELLQRMMKLVHEYDHEISIASVIGILELAKDNLIQECK